MPSLSAAAVGGFERLPKERLKSLSAMEGNEQRPVIVRLIMAVMAVFLLLAILRASLPDGADVECR